ncbi:MAG: ACP S-malonyltransferase [Eubacteriales bacterium]|nr:ACP S-malonyltransferase [Eubacteriales bacterium]
MSKTAFIFSGQGAQYIGMGKQISEAYSSADAIFNKANEALGFDLKSLVFGGEEEALKITENTQPAILATSIACMQPLLENGISPEYTAGLSLGEYSAHVASGTVSFETAVSLVRKRGKFMQEAVPIGVGATAAIIGLDTQAVKESCEQATELGLVVPTNYNCPGQLVIAGEAKAVEKAMEICKEKGAKRAILLPVSAPFHCPLLKPAGDKLKAELKNVHLEDIKIPVVSNVTAAPVKDKNEVKTLLVRQVSSPVLWEDSIRFMISEGIDTFVEIGPGKVLSGFLKRINPDVRAFNVEDTVSLEKTLSEI